jgi:alkylated DNA nucleotide flippase Atl1/trans-aconitate methyltransferase
MDPVEVLARIRAVPHGRVAAYSDITPHAPRLAGRVLAASLEPDLPWHRIVRADGSLAKGDRQRRLLAAEGVRFDPARPYRVDMRRFRVMSETYVHGYHPRENERLRDQAGTLVDLLHHDTAYPAGSSVLEAGCGVGAQTVTLARRSPEARFTSIDVSAGSLAEARRRVDAAGIANVDLRQADIFALPFDRESFDHVFVCFLLEHLSRPVQALAVLDGLLRPGGTITVIEGDHGSAYFHPDSAAAREAIQCQVELQREAGGNSLIGRELYPLMQAAGFGAVSVSPRMVYVDASRPDLVDGFTRKTFTAMIEGVREPALRAGLAEAERFDEGVRGLHRTAEADGVFCYTFFKGVGEKRA